MKKLFVLLLATVMIASMVCPVLAAVQPRYTYIEKVEATLSVNRTTGVATCTGKIVADDAYPVKVVVHLQVANGTKWDPVMSWEQTGTLSASLSRTHTITSGATYRCYVIGYVYDSNGVYKEVGTDYETYTY